MRETSHIRSSATDATYTEEHALFFPKHAQWLSPPTPTPTSAPSNCQVIHLICYLSIHHQSLHLSALISRKRLSSHQICFSFILHLVVDGREKKSPSHTKENKLRVKCFINWNDVRAKQKWDIINQFSRRTRCFKEHSYSEKLQIYLIILQIWATETTFWQMTKTVLLVIHHKLLV